LDDADVSKREDWPRLQNWVIETLAKFDQVFRQRVKLLDAEYYIPDINEEGDI